MAHTSRVNLALEKETGLAPIFSKYHGSCKLVTIGNGHTTIEIEGCPGTRHTSWNVQGNLSFDSPLLPSDPIEKVAVFNAAITDILREVAGLTIDARPFDLTHFCSLSVVFIYRSDQYRPPGEGEVELAAKLMRQELAYNTLVMGHLYDAANRMLFGLDDPFVPKMEQLFLRFLPRDEALHRMFFDEAKTNEVRNAMQQVSFLCQTADELLIKPKDERTIN